MGRQKINANSSATCVRRVTFLPWMCAAAVALLSSSGCSKIWISRNASDKQPVSITTAPIEPKAADVVHAVTKRGETLSAIARRYTGAASNWKKLEGANPKLNPHRLRLGDKITIPGELRIAATEATARAALKVDPQIASEKKPARLEVNSESKSGMTKAKRSAKRSPLPVASAKVRAVEAKTARPKPAKAKTPVAAAAPGPVAAINSPAETKPLPISERSIPELKAPVKAEGGDMLSETTDLLPEFDGTSDRTLSNRAPSNTATDASKDRMKTAISRKATLASELIDPARLAKRPVAAPKVELPSIEKARAADAAPEVASTFLTCRADRCNIRVASE